MDTAAVWGIDVTVLLGMDVDVPAGGLCTRRLNLSRNTRTVKLFTSHPNTFAFTLQHSHSLSLDQSAMEIPMTIKSLKPGILNG